ncbi:MAG: UDP-N-acetylmuramoyl-L-alanine--D-glutamate ligase [Enterobacterales bacterium]|nr:UDP-N-acetylmuramoyl-L-alanine--D-glutamate ligase [Enterobacterales bacterium]
MNENRSIAKHIIFGLGKSGLSCARYFDRINKPYTLIDSREDLKLECLKSLICCQSTFFGELDIQLVEECLQLVVSPGINLNHPLVKRARQLQVDVCGDVELFARECHKPIVAITGSNGKSTVTDLIAKVMSLNGINCQKGGNIGLPVLDFLPLQQADIYVLELSSFQLDSTESLQPDVAILLNISEDHMDRYLDFDDYIHSKKKIFNNAKCRLFNWQDKNTYPFELSALDMPFSSQKLTSKKIKNQAYLQSTEKTFDLWVNDNKMINSKQLNITGIHNMMNVLACLATLHCLNIELSNQGMDGLKSY